VADQVNDLDGTGRLTGGQIEDAFTQLLDGPEEPPEEDSPEGELPATDSLDDEQGMDAELADDSVVDEPDVVEPDEFSDSDAPLYAVTVDGNTAEVPLDELISGYQRQATFTKRNQELASEREILDQERQRLAPHEQALMQERQEYVGVLQQLRQQIEAAAQPPDIDWARLEKEDPVQWLRLRELQRERQGQLQAVQTEQVRMQEILADKNSEELQTRLTSERTMVLEKIPEWSDPELQADEQRKLLEYGKTLGFSEEELGQVYDHRALVALRNAWRYEELTNGTKVKAAKSKIGSAPTAHKGTSRRALSRKQRAQRSKLRKTGKVHDAAAIFEEMLSE